ncbi:ribosome maturation factor RimM [bacterium]|nr:ribosome maturation factor RimM [bacterium]MBU1995323.1 ribosome maturation factor RimM [bacterium]
MSNQSKENSLVHIATIGKVVGLKGDMKFHIKSDFPEQFVKGATFFINKKDSITLESVNLERGLIKIFGYSTPDSVKKFTNANLYTTYEKTKENCHLEEGQFFWFDILGCSIVEDSKCLGIVEEVERIGIVDYLSIKTDAALVAKEFTKNFLIPYQPQFIIKTDIEKKVINVHGAMDILEAS